MRSIVYRVIVFMLCYPSSHLLLMFSVQFFQKSCRSNGQEKKKQMRRIEGEEVSEEKSHRRPKIQKMKNEILEKRSRHAADEIFNSLLL